MVVIFPLYNDTDYKWFVHDLQTILDELESYNLYLVFGFNHDETALCGDIQNIVKFLLSNKLIKYST